MARKVFLLRHGQALHTFAPVVDLADICSDPGKFQFPAILNRTAVLSKTTSLDLQQKGQLQALSVPSTYSVFFESLDPKQTTLITSPLRRTIQTTLAAFASILPPIASNPVELLIMPECVETGSGWKPCDTGANLDETKLMFPQEFLNWSRCKQGWNLNKGFYDSTEQGLMNRARWFRKYLRDECQTETVVVVCHHGFLRRITKTPHEDAHWPNSELREYRFKDQTGQDAEADLERVVHPIL
ncbi:hypothetical protein OIO90_006361 [Microbotryomycetes sp. JL221]|nr:hypothetical protein OIO90_006361 [Microbotryomycetes sp. JL221]